MKYEVKFTNQFKKDFKLAARIKKLFGNEIQTVTWFEH